MCDLQQPRIIVMSSESEKSAFDQRLENSRFLVAPAPRNDKKKARGRILRLKSKLAEKERVQAQPAPLSSQNSTSVEHEIGDPVRCKAGNCQHWGETAFRTFLSLQVELVSAVSKVLENGFA